MHIAQSRATLAVIESCRKSNLTKESELALKKHGDFKKNRCSIPNNSYHNPTINTLPMYKTMICLGMFWALTGTAFAQDSAYGAQALFNELKEKDSLIFNLGFNNCDTMQLRNLLSDDFEFYHDQNGVVASKEIFINNIPNLCKMNYKPTRVLVKNSLEVFPLFSNGKLYGAIQTGIHEFYGEEKNKPKYLTSTARFTHVWILEGGDWTLKRVLSYDHVVPKK